MRPLTIEEANKIYDVISAICGAPKYNRLPFINLQTTEFIKEYRFMGDLGYGGKFWRNNNRWYVNCYNEDNNQSIQKRISVANEMLDNLRFIFMGKEGF